MRVGEIALDTTSVIEGRLVPDGLLSTLIEIGDEDVVLDIPRPVCVPIVEYLTNENCDWQPTSTLERFTASYCGIRLADVPEVNENVVQNIVNNILNESQVVLNLGPVPTTILKRSLLKLGQTDRPVKLLKATMEVIGPGPCHAALDALRTVCMVQDLFGEDYTPSSGMTYFTVFRDSANLKLFLETTNLDCAPFLLPEQFDPLPYLDASFPDRALLVSHLVPQEVQQSFASLLMPANHEGATLHPHAAETRVRTSAPNPHPCASKAAPTGTSLLIQLPSLFDPQAMIAAESSLFARPNGSMESLSDHEAPTEIHRAPTALSSQTAPVHHSPQDDIFLPKGIGHASSPSHVDFRTRSIEVGSIVGERPTCSVARLDDQVVSGELYLSWVLLGLCNNVIYVILNTASKDFADGYTGTILFFNIVPGLVIKFLAPYIAHLIPSYLVRFWIPAVMFTLGILAVPQSTSFPLTLGAVSMCSVASGWGESSALPLMSRYPQKVVGAWGLGTGLAGVTGTLWPIVFNQVLGFNKTIYMSSAVMFVALYVFAIHIIMAQESMYVPFIAHETTKAHEEAVAHPHRATELEEHAPVASKDSFPASATVSHAASNSVSYSRVPSGISLKQRDSSRQALVEPVPLDDNAQIDEFFQRNYFSRMWIVTRELKRPMYALFFVYLFEYVANSGVWAAISFKNMPKMKTFFFIASFMYQIGVVISRTFSVDYLNMPLGKLWPFPTFQLFVLSIGVLQALTNFWGDAYSFLFVLVFIEGLMGGACYVRGFAHIRESTHPRLREFYLSVASIADSVGISLAAISSIFLETWLREYRAEHGLNLDTSISQ